jgi:pimeloyl-ACP methyl ester carboxylesterase
MDGFDCTERLGEIEVPTLVIHGRGDHLVPFECGEEIASGIPHARLAVLPDGHQALFKKHGREMVEEIRRFVAGS